MRYLAIDNVASGTRLAKPIYNAKGAILLRENFELTDGILKRLEELGYVGLYIEDEVSEGILIEDVIDEQLKLEAAFQLEQIVNKNGNINDMLPFITNIVDNIIENKDVVINMNKLYRHHEYTFMHCVNVGIISISIGAKLNMSRKSLLQLGTAGILHDVGKRKVPIAILDKQGKLSSEEFKIIKKHPQYGYDILSDSTTLSSVSRVGVLQHHERFDGSEYPCGLKGNKITLFAQIVAVADTYDAMTTDRAYRAACTPSESIEFLMGVGNHLYDLKVIMNFMKCIAVYPVGTTVMLSDGTKGIVMKNYSDCILRPMIKNIETKEIIDLKNDETYLTICVLNTVK